MIKVTQIAFKNERFRKIFLTILPYCFEFWTLKRSSYTWFLYLRVQNQNHFLDSIYLKVFRKIRKKIKVELWFSQIYQSWKSKLQLWSCEEVCYHLSLDSISDQPIWIWISSGSGTVGFLQDPWPNGWGGRNFALFHLQKIGCWRAYGVLLPPYCTQLSHTATSSRMGTLYVGGESTLLFPVSGTLAQDSPKTSKISKKVGYDYQKDSTRLLG